MWSAATALLAGSTTEAVALFSAALDSAGERYVRALCREHGLAPELVDATWAGMGTGTGQRAGALSILFLVDTATPLGLDAGMTNLRDRVVHQSRKFGLGSKLGPISARPVPGARQTDVHASVRETRRQWKEREAREYGAYVYSLVTAIERALERHPPVSPGDDGLAAREPNDQAIDPAWSFDDFLLAVRRTATPNP